MSEFFKEEVAIAEQHEVLSRQGRVAVLDAGGQYVNLVRKAIERQGAFAYFSIGHR